MNYKDFFIAIYTHSCKKYCDEEFFNALFNSGIEGATVEIVDNSLDEDYIEKLKLTTKKEIHHIDIDRSKPELQFVKNVTESVSFLRELFLKTDCKYFVILESDVVPPKNWLDYFLEVIEKADIIGGIYYWGFHGEHLFEKDDLLEYTTHVLSGCTLYKREVVKKFPFRYDNIEAPGAFPDGWISYDARNNGYKLANYSKIQCRHLTKVGSDSRGFEDIE